MKQLAIITIGVSGSGKSYWAENLVERNDKFRELNRDNIRSYLFPYLHNGNCVNYYKMPELKEREKVVTEHMNILIERAFNEGKNIIISDTNLNEHFRNEMVKMLQDIGFRVEYKIFTTDLPVCLERDSNRLRNVGNDVILSQYSRFITFLRNYEKEMKRLRLRECHLNFKRRVENNANEN